MGPPSTTTPPLSPPSSPDATNAHGDKNFERLVDLCGTSPTLECLAGNKRRVIAYLCIHNSPLEDNLFVKLYHHEQGIIRDSVLTYI